MVHWTLPPERAPPWFDLESPLCSPFAPMLYISIKLSPEAQTHPILSHMQWPVLTQPHANLQGGDTLQIQYHRHPTPEWVKPSTTRSTSRTHSPRHAPKPGNASADTCPAANNINAHSRRN
ncbi:hypothetical protein SKAU_G00061720 [Synaphobranchus kaupii]|uniref:Uncharacterized protein n=1 Tax=Synaphobranchus kaupii TaxID=118154 RepID=A0A9Q1G516_SYNKA|nr:hypothetical protein SKAU_G00061720 [Synaphobranchus kaupii]